MAGKFERDLKHTMNKVAAEAMSDAAGGAQRDLDALLRRGPEIEAAQMRAEVESVFRRHGFDAPDSEVDRCAAALSVGERVVLTWDGKFL